MTVKKNPKDYEYGKRCTDHLGNEYKTIQDMCIHYNIPYSTFIKRKNRGWDLEKILSTPPKSYKWRTPYRNMGYPYRENYEDYEEIPSSRRYKK